MGVRSSDSILLATIEDQMSVNSSKKRQFMVRIGEQRFESIMNGERDLCEYKFGLKISGFLFALKKHFSTDKHTFLKEKVKSFSNPILF